MTFEEILDQAIAMLQRRGHVTYRLLQRQFQLDDDTLSDLLAELRYAHGEVIMRTSKAWSGQVQQLCSRHPLPSVAAFPGRCLSRSPSATGGCDAQTAPRPLTPNGASSRSCSVTW